MPPSRRLSLILAVSTPMLVGCGSDLVVDEIATGLEVPWAMEFAPDGRLFLTERAGRIRVVTSEGLRERPWWTVDVFDRPSLEAGLMGMALHPQFPQPADIYICYTLVTGDEIKNRVARVIGTQDGGTHETILLDDIPAAEYHNGCKIVFGPDGNLYIATGDALIEEIAQDTASLAGKILRIMPSGNIPPNNPFPNSPIWSLGHRNAQGMTWDDSGQLWSTEHGTSDFNEINLIEQGGNYGWPLQRIQDQVAPFIHPVLGHGRALADVAWVPEGPTAGGSLIATMLGDGGLFGYPIDPGSGGLNSVVELIGGEFGRLRAVAIGPSGDVYVGTSNRDGRGRRRAGDDRIIRITDLSSLTMSATH